MYDFPIFISFLKDVCLSVHTHSHYTLCTYNTLTTQTLHCTHYTHTLHTHSQHQTDDFPSDFISSLSYLHITISVATRSVSPPRTSTGLALAEQRRSGSTRAQPTVMTVARQEATDAKTTPTVVVVAYRWERQSIQFKSAKPLPARSQRIGGREGVKKKIKRNRKTVIIPKCPLNVDETHFAVRW